MNNNKYSFIQNQLENIVINAVNAFNENEKYLIENRLSERCMCARFAMHLTKALTNTPFSDYIVDVEYNRGARGHTYEIKRINNRPITVDLIVHKRGYDPHLGFDNLVCMEMKVSTDRRGCTDDEERLEIMTNINNYFCYYIGFMLLVNMERNKKCLEIKRKFVLH